MNIESLIDVSTLLPPIQESKLRPWTQSFGGDYYGAFQVAAEYCGLSKVPARFPGSWQHGAMPPWWKIRPEVIVYNAPKTARCFVARQDEVAFLKEGGYRKVRAIGLPIIYTKPSGLQRIPNSLLVMPTHSMASDVQVASNLQYIREIASIKNRFGLVAACVSAPCFAKGLWTSEFAEQGIQVIRGAGIYDVNALKRMRALFDTFEYVTTDSYGSHVFYALYFGAKVSIWGSATPLLRENVLADGTWTPYPEAVDKLLSEETARKAEVYLAALRVDPWIGVQNVEVTNSMLGHDHKLSADEMRAAFGWTPLSILVESAREMVHHSSFWRAGATVKRRLLMTAKKYRQSFVSIWPVRPLIRKTLALACRVAKEQENIIRDRRKSPAAILNTDVPDEVGAALDAIPSETSPLERRYLYRLFSTFWDPSGDVLEVGPFLGGTTRAIAMGMMHHSRFRESSRLDTCDKFQGYYDRQALLDYLQPAFVSGQLGPAARDAMGSSTSFREVFAHLHERESYYRILNILNTPLPDRPKDAGMDGTFKANPNRRYTAIFVDGCKSWFSTKYLVKEVLPCISPECVFIYQDYGWYTCFWIPAFIARFPEAFEPLGYADQTYAFTYRGNLSAESIDSFFPDTPHDLHPAEFAAIFNELADRAAAQQNLRAEMMAQLQYVASLAYCGHSTQARVQMAEIGKRADFQNRFPDILAMASQSPTYTPDGKISL